MRRSLGLTADLDVLDLGQNRHRRGGRVDTPLRFGDRNALDAMHARLELHLRVHLVALDAKRHFLESTGVAPVRVDLLDLPLLELGVAGVHAVQVAREDRGLVTAGATSDLHDDVLLVVRVARQHHHLEFVLKIRQASFEFLDLLGGELLHLGIALGVKDFLGLVEFVEHAQILPRLLGDRGLAALLLGQARVLLLVAQRRRVGELRGQLVVGVKYLLKLLTHVLGSSLRGSRER